MEQPKSRALDSLLQLLAPYKSQQKVQKDK